MKDCGRVLPIPEMEEFRCAVVGCVIVTGYAVQLLHFKIYIDRHYGSHGGEKSFRSMFLLRDDLEYRICFGFTRCGLAV